MPGCRAVNPSSSLTMAPAALRISCPVGSAWSRSSPSRRKATRRNPDPWGGGGMPMSWSPPLEWPTLSTGIASVTQHRLGPSPEGLRHDRGASSSATMTAFPSTSCPVTTRRMGNVMVSLPPDSLQQYGVALHRLHMHRVQRGEPVRGRLVPVYTRFNLLQAARHCATGLCHDRHRAPTAAAGRYCNGKLHDPTRRPSLLHPSAPPRTGLQWAREGPGRLTRPPPRRRLAR